MADTITNRIRSYIEPSLLILVAIYGLSSSTTLPKLSDDTFKAVYSQSLK